MQMYPYGFYTKGLRETVVHKSCDVNMGPVSVETKLWCRWPRAHAERACIECTRVCVSVDARRVFVIVCAI